MMNALFKKGVATQQFGRFVIVGSLNTGIDAGLFWLLTRMFGIEPLVASTFSFLAGSVNSFIMNKHWTFNNAAARTEAVRQYIKFMMVSTVVLGLHQVFLLTLHHGFGYADLVAKVCGIAVGVAAGFLLNKFWVFDWATGKKIHLHW